MIFPPIVIEDFFLIRRESMTKELLPLLSWMDPLFFFFLSLIPKTKISPQNCYHADMESLAGNEGTEGKRGQASQMSEYGVEKGNGPRSEKQSINIFFFFFSLT
jgi:hypothetical protein